MLDEETLTLYATELRPLTLKSRDKIGGLSSCTALQQWIGDATGLPSLDAQGKVRALRRVFSSAVANAQQRLQERKYRDRKSSDLDCLVAGIAEILASTERAAFDALLAADPEARRIYEARGTRGHDAEASRKLRMAVWLGTASMNTGHYQTDAGLKALLKAADQLLDDAEQITVLRKYLQICDQAGNALITSLGSLPPVANELAGTSATEQTTTRKLLPPSGDAPVAFVEEIDSGLALDPAAPTSDEHHIKVTAPHDISTNMEVDSNTLIESTARPNDAEAYEGSASDTLSDYVPEALDSDGHSDQHVPRTASSWLRELDPRLLRVGLRVALGLVPVASFVLLVAFAHLLPPSRNPTFWPIHRWLIEHVLLEVAVLMPLAVILGLVLTLWRLWLACALSSVSIAIAVLFMLAGGLLYDIEVDAGKSLVTRTRGWPTAFSDGFDSEQHCGPPPQADSAERRGTFTCFAKDGTLHLALRSGDAVASSGYQTASDIPLLRDAFVETVFRAENGSALASCGLLISGSARMLFLRLRSVHTANLRHAEPLDYYVAEVIELSLPGAFPGDKSLPEESAKVIKTSPQLAFIERKSVWGAKRSATLVNLEITAGEIAVYVERRKVLTFGNSMTEIRVSPAVLADTQFTTASCSFEYMRSRVRPS